MAEPLIDVLIPAFNAAATLRSAVRSILDQTVTDIRVIVVDDGSTDATPDIMQELALEDARVYPVTQLNGGIVAARNSGLQHSTARYFACLDADDLAYPDRFALQIAYLQSNADCVAVGAHARHIDSVGADIGHVGRMRDPAASDPEWVPSREPYMIQSSLMTYTDLVKAAGGYRHVTLAEDTDLFWRLQEMGRLHIMPETLMDYRLHDDSISSKSLLNGRISATFSQLSAIAAMRKRRSAPDIYFEAGNIASYRQANSLDGMFILAKRGLEPDEAAYLEVAIAAKMLELVSYRPYDLDIEDCAFIRRALNDHSNRIKASNRPELKRSWTGYAAQLALKGKWREANRLVTLRQYPEVAGRFLFYRLFPKELKTTLRRLLGRDGSYTKTDS